GRWAGDHASRRSSFDMDLFCNVLDRQDLCELVKPMPGTSDPILEFKDVSLRYEDTWALNNVSFSLQPGETRIILGAAGSGKTTLLKAGIGLVAVDRGNIELFGEQITSREEHQLYSVRSRVGMLFQEGGLFDSLSVGENVVYPLINQQTSDQPN